jgi:hypothetical protein
MVRTEIDDQGLIGELLGDLGRTSVGQGQEDDVDSRHFCRVDVPDRQCSERLKMRVNIADQPAGCAVALDRADAE